MAVAVGWFGLGGWTLVVGAMCDSLDGAVARERGLASDAGEVLDAAVDRWAEMAVFFGFAYYYRNDPVGFVLAAAACAGAVMVSYARAKGEAMGVDARMGLMQRHERAAYLCLACCPLPTHRLVVGAGRHPPALPPGAGGAGAHRRPRQRHGHSTHRLRPGRAAEAGTLGRP